jgi:26S proteasome regulatory subunit N8
MCVVASERVVGFYSTGPSIRAADLQIEELFRRFCSHPVLVIIDVRANTEGIPTKAYGAMDEVEEDGKALKTSFKHIQSVIGAYEAEEVGVEHLLRDVNDPSVSSLASQIKQKMASLGGLKEKLQEMGAYLQNVHDGKLPANNQIIYNMQTIFNLLPNLNVDEMLRSMFVKSNDFYMIIYMAALIRSVIALHNLVNNKIKYKKLHGLVEEEEEKKEKKEEKKEEPKVMVKSGPGAQKK